MVSKYKSTIITVIVIIMLSVVFYSPNQSMASGNRSTGILLTAKSLIGTPYRSGGITPKGFDCSGFVNYVYKKNGIKLSRSSKSMWKSGGKKVSNLNKGDVLFFNTNGSTVSHVGIYLGNGQFIHSAQRGVKIDRLAEKYYRHTYIGAKRFL